MAWHFNTFHEFLSNNPQTENPTFFCLETEFHIQLSWHNGVNKLVSHNFVFEGQTFSNNHVCFGSPSWSMSKTIPITSISLWYNLVFLFTQPLCHCNLLRKWNLTFNLCRFVATASNLLKKSMKFMRHVFRQCKRTLATWKKRKSHSSSDRQWTWFEIQAPLGCFYPIWNKKQCHRHFF